VRTRDRRLYGVPRPTVSITDRGGGSRGSGTRPWVTAPAKPAPRTNATESGGGLHSPAGHSPGLPSVHGSTPQPGGCHRGFTAQPGLCWALVESRQRQATQSRGADLHGALAQPSQRRPLVEGLTGLKELGPTNYRD
jgi:hypothetical protein